MSEKSPLTYPKLDIRNFYLEKQNEEGVITTDKTTKSENSGLARFSYIAQMRNTIEKEHSQSKIFIDMEKFNYIIKQYCDILKEKKTIDKKDIIRIESKEKYESKPKESMNMNKKSPDLAGLLSNVFSPISNFVENSFLDKTIEKVSKDSMASDSKMSTFQNNSQETIIPPSAIDGSISIGEIFGMSSTFIQTNDTDTLMEENEKSKDDKIKSQSNIKQEISTLEGIIGLSSSFLPQGSSNNSTLISNVEIEESRGITDYPLYLVENKTKDEFQEKPITLEKLFGLSSSLSPEESVNDGKRENGVPTVISRPQNKLSSETEEQEDNSKIHFTSQSSIEQAISIEDMIGLSSSFLPAHSLHLSILPSNNKIEDNKTDIPDNSSYFRENRTEKELTDEPITVGEIFGLSSNFASVEESLIKNRDKENENFDEEKQSFEVRVKEISNNKIPESKDLGNAYSEEINGKLKLKEEDNIDITTNILINSDNFDDDYDYRSNFKEANKKEEIGIFTTNVPFTSDSIHDDYAFRSYSEEVGEEKEIDIFTTNTPITSDIRSNSEEASMIREGNSESDYPDQYIQKQNEKVVSQLEGLKKSSDERNFNLSFTYGELYYNQENNTVEVLSAEEIIDPLLSFESGQKTEAITLEVTDDDEYLVPSKTNETTIITDSKPNHQKDHERIISTEKVFEKGRNSEMENSSLLSTDLGDDKKTFSHKVDSQDENLSSNLSDKEIKQISFEEFNSSQISASDGQSILTGEHSVTEKSQHLTTSLADHEKPSSYEENQDLLSQQFSDDMLPSEEPKLLIQNLEKKEKEKSNLIYTEMHPTPLFLAQQDIGSSVNSDKINVGKNDEVKKNYSLEVLFIEEENASIDIDYPESVSIEKSDQESRSGSMNSPIFYIKQNNKKSSDSGISYKPMFNASDIKNPWYRKFEFFCVGKNVLMVLKKRTNMDD